MRSCDVLSQWAGMVKHTNASWLYLLRYSGDESPTIFIKTQKASRYVLRLPNTVLQRLTSTTDIAVMGKPLIVVAALIVIVEGSSILQRALLITMGRMCVYGEQRFFSADKSPNDKQCRNRQ